MRLHIVSIAVSCVLLLAVPHAWTKDKRDTVDMGADELVRMGIAAANAGDTDRAIKLFSDCLEVSKSSVEACYNRGKVYLIQGDLKHAQGDLDKAIRLDSELAGAYSARSIVHRRRGNLAKAAKDLKKAIELDPEDSTALMNRADLYFLSGQYEEALADLTRVVKTNPTMTRALGNRAYILEQIGRYDDAIKDLSAIIARQPDNLLAIKHLGFVHRQKGKPSEAIRWYKAAMKLERDRVRQKLLEEEIKEMQRRAQER